MPAGTERGETAPLTEFSQSAEPLIAAPKGRLGGVLRVWDRAENVVVGVLAALTLGIVVYTIFVRLVVPGLTPSWADETTVYLMIWATMIACSGVTATRHHVRADLLTSTLSPKSQARLELLSNICGMAFCGLLAWYGFAVARDAWEFDDLSTTTLRFPMWIYYACLPVGAGLMSLRYLILTWLMLTGAPAPAAPVSAHH